MNIRVGPYLRLFRLWPVLWTYITFINPVVMGCMINRKAPLWLKFAAGNVLMPIALGVVLTIAFSGIAHKPFMMLLPGARRYYRNAQLAGFAVCVALGVGISYLNDSTLPLPAIVGAVMASAAIAIPWEPYVLWNGSRRLANACVAVVLLVVWRGAELHAFGQAWPWVFMAVGVALAALCFRLAFDRERLRERALSSSLTSTLFSANFQKAARQHMAKDNTIGRDWHPPSTALNLSTYRHALWHERFGARKKGASRKATALLLLLYAVLAGIGVAAYFGISGRPLEWGVVAGFLHVLVWTESWGAPPVVPFMANFAAVLACMLTLTFPRADRLYPLSRRDLARLALRMSALRVAGVYVCLALGALALAWGSARLAGRPFEFRLAPLFAGPLLLVPAIPFVALACLRLSRRATLHLGSLDTFGGLGGLAVLILGPLAATVGAMWADAYFSPLALLALGGATILSIAFYVSRVKKFYLGSDLVERAAA